MNDNTAIVRSEGHYDGLSMVVSPAEAKQRLQQLQAFVKSVMVEGEDYGAIPGTGDKKCLLQPGAQKLSEVYGFAHRFEPIESVKDWERGFFHFEYRCILTSRRDGSFVGEGIGSCNSRETKYAGRWVQEAEVPHGLNKDTLKQRTASEWLFASKLPQGVNKDLLPVQWRKSKKGSEYPVYQLTVTTYQVPNEEICSLVNTIQKMACKRAYVHAVIAATRSSSILTQDLEDLPASAYGSVEETPAPVEVHDTERPPPPIEPANLQQARYAQRMGEIAAATSMVALKRVWSNISADVRSTAITLEQHNRLLEVKDRRKAELMAPPPDAFADALDVGDDPAGLG